MTQRDELAEEILISKLLSISGYQNIDDFKKEVDADTEQWGVIVKAMQAYHEAKLSEITDEDIELYARENSLTKATEDGIIKGAKDFRDNKIKHIE